MQIVKILLPAAIIMVGLSGCQTARDAIEGGPRINENVYLPRNAGVAESHDVVPAIIPRPCRPGPYDQVLVGHDLKLEANTDNGTRSVAAGSSAPNYAPDPFEEFAYTVQGAELNTCVDAMKALIDMRWYAFQHAVNGSLSTSNFLVDAAVTGLTTSIPLVAPGTKNVLGAIATGLLGTRKNFDEDVLYSYSVRTILQQMETDRAAVGTLIEHHLDGSGTPYRNLYQAENDLFDYASAGSWDHAMASLTTNIAAQTAACQARLRDEKMGKQTDTLPGGQTPTSTASDPCNAPPPAKPATQPITVTFNKLVLASDQDKVLDAAASLIRTGVAAGTISGAVITGQAATGGTTADADARANLVKTQLEDKTNPARNVPDADITVGTSNTSGADVAIISFSSPQPAPSGDQDQGAPMTKTAAAPPPVAPVPATEPDLVAGHTFHLSDGRKILILGKDNGTGKYSFAVQLNGNQWDLGNPLAETWAELQQQQIAAAP